jgi:hypothetical protein
VKSPTDLSLGFGSVAWTWQMPTLLAVAIVMTIGLAVFLVAFADSA